MNKNNGYKYQWHQSNKHINIGINSTYSVLYWFPLPNVLCLPLSINLIGITEHRRFLMRCLQYSFCKHHSSSTSYHSNTECVTYQIKLSHLRTGQITKVDQYCCQHSSWPSNRPAAHLLQPVCKKMNLLWCSVFLLLKLRYENPIRSNETK